MRQKQKTGQATSNFVLGKHYTEELNRNLVEGSGRISDMSEEFCGR